MSAATPERLVIAPGPHLRVADTTRSIMWWVNASLAPIVIWGGFVFGPNALIVVAASIGGAVGAEWLAGRMLKRRAPIDDGSAVCTGLLLALTLPPLVSWWMAALGAAFAILVAKWIFGGLGYNLFNPALAGRAFMMACFPLAMTAGWAAPRADFTSALDAVTTATPLAVLREQGLAEAVRLVAGPGGWAGLALGFRPGSIGETPVILIALGGAILVARGIIGLTIPISVFAGVLLTTFDTGALDVHLLGGGLWLGAFYMATDYVTSPTTRPGQIAFGLLVGALTGLIRRFGGYPEGICYAILIANAVVPAFNLWFRPRRTAMVGSPS